MVVFWMGEAWEMRGGWVDCEIQYSGAPAAHQRWQCGVDTKREKTKEGVCVCHT